MSCMDCLNCVGNFISEIARLILFFASIIFILCSIVLLVASTSGTHIYSLLEINQITACFYAIILLSAVLIILGILGFYGTFFRSQSSLEWFAIGTSLIVIVGFGVLMYVSPRLKDSNDAAGLKLQGYLAKYDWPHKSTDYEVKNATYIWDEVQEMYHCCGVDEPKDWATFGPKTTGVFPISCCSNVTAAKENDYRCTSTMDHWNDGCKGQIHQIFSALPDLLTVLVLANLVLGCVSCVVMLCSSEQSSNF